MAKKQGELDLSHPYRWSCVPNVQDEPRRRKSRRERRDYSSRDLVLGFWAAKFYGENQTWWGGVSR